MPRWQITKNKITRNRTGNEGLRRTIFRGKGTPPPKEVFDPDSVAYFNRMDVQPSLERKRLLNKTIQDLKLAQLWEKLYFLHLFAGHDRQAALLDVKGKANGSVVNGLSFTQDRGFVGPATNGLSYINVANNPAEFTSKFPDFNQNDCAIGTWQATNIVSDNKGTIGSGSVASGRLLLYPKQAFWMFGNTSVAASRPSFTLTDNRGLVMGSRNGLSVDIYQNENRIVNGFNMDMDYAPSQTLFYFRTNPENGNIVSLGFMSTFMTAAQSARFYEIIKHYMDGVGNVIS